MHRGPGPLDDGLDALLPGGDPSDPLAAFDDDALARALRAPSLPRIDGSPSLPPLPTPALPTPAPGASRPPPLRSGIAPRRPSSAPPGARRTSSAPPEPTRAQRLEALASEIGRSGPAHLEPLLLRAARAGVELLPHLAREVPGLLWIDLSRLGPTTRAVHVSAACAVIASFGADAAPVLTKLLAPTSPWHVRLCAARIAAEAPSPSLIRPLVAMLPADEDLLGEAAALALAPYAGSSELASMLARLSDALADRRSPPYWRRTATRTFRRLRDRSAIPALIDALGDDEPIASGARDALRAITGKDLGAYRLPWLVWWRAQPSSRG